MIQHRLIFTLAAGVLCASCGGCEDEEREAAIALSGGDGTAELREVVISAAPPEGDEAGFLAGTQPALTDVLTQIRAVGDHDYARGLFLRVGPLGSWGRASDLREAIQHVRTAEKPVHCHFDLADNVTYWLLATSCDRVSMTPGGYLDLVGFAAQALYFRSALEELGVQAELLQVGRFKGAADPFVRDDMAPEVRETLTNIVNGFTDALVAGVAESRNLPTEAARALLDDGPFDAITARAAGLVDDVGFEDEAREHARLAASVSRVRTLRLTPPPPELGVTELIGALSGERLDTTPVGPRLAVVRLSGTIVDGEEGDEAQRAGPFVRNLVRLADDEEVKAVVLRIDSPGGSALASDRMWEAVRRVANRKPIVVSVGDMAASGGYYIASAGSRIFAHEQSLVGSIGVVGGKIDASALLERLGISAVVIAGSERAAWSTVSRPWTDAERAIVRDRLESAYHLFLRRIRTGRPQADLERGAAGRLMSGEAARELGLIDELGGLGPAMAYAREQGGLPADSAIEYWPRRKSPMESLAELMGGSSGAAAPDWSTLLPEVSDCIALSRILDREMIASVLPYRLQLQ